MKQTILLIIAMTFLTLKNKAQTVTDIDGNVYNTVTIGTQIWLKENLKTTRYRDGSIIPNDTNNTTWHNLSTGAMCYFFNDSITNKAIYGGLYNWYAVNDSRNLAPIGCHVASDTEWTTLINYLGGANVAGGKLKEADTSHWDSPNTGATNVTGFTALPGGSRSSYGSWGNIGNSFYCWSSHEISASNAWYLSMSYNSANIMGIGFDKRNGFSVRCLMDSTTSQINEIFNDNSFHIFPNPAIDRVYIYCPSRKHLKIQVYNIIGEKIIQSELTGGNIEIDISSLSKGIYLIRLVGNDWTGQKKLIKE
jgi:uncharacterized protein (TIGR02145 family)